MKRSRRSVAWDHFELKNDLVHCQHCEAIPETGGEEEPALSDTDEGSAKHRSRGQVSQVSKELPVYHGDVSPLRASFSAVGLTVTRLRSRLTPEHVNMLIFNNTNP
ncbi:unnamed protein product [Pleuronectes platessa]|uniref:Uncharacterized protein n=1 Tax=Pleuronectes platessa TaxID=8262 RepID=A0A9N7U8H2_PLEPL|nr:unnamed protein product [Pleuronectes platessa]